MNNKDTTDRFEDIVFEGRNKLYGAYLLRKSYHMHLAYSLIISICVMIIFLLSVFKITNYQQSNFYVNSGSNYHTVDVDLLDKPYGLRSVKPAGGATPPDFVLPKIVEVPTNTITEAKKAEKSSDNDTIVSINSGSESKDSDEVASNGNGTDGEVYGTADVYPLFPGGIKAMQDFINENLKYPEIARATNIRGTIQIYVLILSNGKLKDIKVVKGLQPELDNEVMRVIKSMPLWNPALRGGVPVNVQCVIPISVSPLR